jgi:hypothetical protein
MSRVWYVVGGDHLSVVTGCGILLAVVLGKLFGCVIAAAQGLFSLTNA